MIKTIVLLILLNLVYGCSDKNISKQQKKEIKSEVIMEKLLNPAICNEKAPDYFKVKFITTKGDFVIEVQREWAPLGVDRFYNLVKNGFYNNNAFFRVIKGFVAQFGISPYPEVSQKWLNATIEDDPIKISNERGTISFATRGPNTRTTQLFINYSNNSRLDSMGFSPFGRVIDGIEVLDDLYSGYGEGEPYGKGPSQYKIITEGNEYLKKNFPMIDYIKETIIVE
mgnify:CR=1 FL=1